MAGRHRAEQARIPDRGGAAIRRAKLFLELGNESRGCWRASKRSQLATQAFVGGEHRRTRATAAQMRLHCRQRRRLQLTVVKGIEQLERLFTSHYGALHYHSH